MPGRSAAAGAGKLARVRTRITTGLALVLIATMLRSGPVDEADLARIATALGLDRSDLLESAWIDNGPGWVGVLLKDAVAVLAVEPDWAAFGDLKVGVVGEYAHGDLAVEVRAFCPISTFPVYAVMALSSPM